MDRESLVRIIKEQTTAVYSPEFFFVSRSFIGSARSYNITLSAHSEYVRIRNWRDVTGSSTLGHHIMNMYIKYGNIFLTEEEATAAFVMQKIKG